MAILSREDTGPRPQRPAGAAKTGLPGPETACAGQPRILPVSGQWPGPFPCAGAGCGRRRPQTNKEWPTGCVVARRCLSFVHIPAASSARRTAARPATGTRPVGTGPCRWTKRAGSSSINRLPLAVRAAVQRTARAQGAAASATRATAPHLRLFSRSASSSSFM